MKKKNVIFIILITLFSVSVFAHQDFYVIKEVGNIKTRIKTGYDYEEIKKVQMIGELAQQLSKELNYYEPILLDFDHFYVGSAKPTYFLSFDNGIINYNSSGSRTEKPLLEKEGIIVRQVSSKFNILNTLKMLEYAIKNREQIKKEQKKIKYIENYCNWIINSIKTSEIQADIEKNESQVIRKIKSKKIYRPEKKNYWGVTYFWKNNSYHIVFKKGKEEKMITTLDNVYDFQKKHNVVFIFETKELFIVIKDYENNKLSKKWKIKNIEENYKLFKIENLSYDKYSMITNYYTKEVGIQPKDRIMIYSKNKDKLIQDLDKLMKN